MVTALDELDEAQEDIKRTADNLGRSLKMMGDKLTSAKWNDQLEGSTYYTQFCSDGVAPLAKKAKRIRDAAQGFTAIMKTLTMMKFNTAFAKDASGWDCDLMYPGGQVAGTTSGAK